MKRTPLKRKSTLKRSTSPKTAPGRAKKGKKTQKDMWNEYGLEKPSKPRYSGLAGILWYVTSQYVRKEEFIKYGGRCVDNCGWVAQAWNEDTDCGHFRPAKSLATRFLRENLALQRKHCNSPRGGNGRQYDFGIEIDKRYGLGTAERLTELSKTTSKPFSKEWYHQEILRIQALLKE